MGQNNIYIKIPAIYKKLKRAEEEQKTLYIQGSMGYGKTAAVLYFYRKKKLYCLSGKRGFPEDLPEVSALSENTVFVDDLLLIRDEASREYVKQLIQDKGKHVILASRGSIPTWLKVTYAQNPFLLASARDLKFGPEETKKLLESHGLMASQEEIRALTEDCIGNGLFLQFHIYRYGNQPAGETYGPQVHQEAEVDIFQYLENTHVAKWKQETQKILLSLAAYPEFDLQMARMLSGDENAGRYLEEIQETGDFIFLRRNGLLEFHFELRRYLMWKQRIVWNGEQIRSNHDRAGLYYEQKGEVEKALDQYSHAGNTKRVMNILRENAKRRVGVAHLYELRTYYLQLPEQEVLRDPVLMAGLSMLYSLLLQSEKSEEWYGRLKEYEQHQRPGSPTKKEAKERLIYLDIALPHRGIVGITGILKRAAIMYANKEIFLPEWSLTSNLPSLMNGGKDFCAWSRNDRHLTKVMGRPVELILGNFGIGLVNTALAESLFEKGSPDRQELLKLLNSGYAQAETGGAVEVCFVAASILAKMDIQRGKIDAALKLLDAMEQKVMEEKAERLLPNMKAFRIWIALVCGRTEAAERWFHTAPDENVDFYVLDRFRYMIKLRVYILFGKYEEAWNLSERLAYYASEHHRYYLQTENLFLRAIMYYRRNNTLWKKTLLTALKRCEEYHFVWIAAREGAALVPLLDQCRDNPFFQSAFGKEILEKTEQMANLYPAYLREQKIITEPLTETEEKILRMHCMGLSTHEILGRLFIQESTLKFHNTNIFRKLEVKNRQEAVRAAKGSGLIQMGEF